MTTAPTRKASYTLPPLTPTWSPIATVAPSGHGRPYTAESVAHVMAVESTTWLPTPLRNEFVAAALADVIWSFDGRPYARLIIDGSCADDGLHCSVLATGTLAFALDRNISDYYWFDSDFRTGLGPGRLRAGRISTGTRPGA